MPEIYNTRGDESSYLIDSTVGRSFGEEQPSEFIHVTCYAALRYLADFRAGWSFDEGQVPSCRLSTTPIS